MPEPTLAINHDLHEGEAAAVWKVRLRGELDVSTAAHLEDVLGDVEQRGAQIVMLDLTEVSFLDSSGLRAIVRAQHHFRGQERTLLIDGLSPAARRVLELTGVLEGLTARGDAEG